MVQKILNVAEKNDAAKNIADIMSRGGFNRREGWWMILIVLLLF